MRILLITIVSAIVMLHACRKYELVNRRMVKVVYEVNTRVDGLQVRIGEYYNDNGFAGVERREWAVQGKGVHTRTVLIERNFEADISAVHKTSDQWSIRILDVNGKVLAEAPGVTRYAGPPPYYHVHLTHTVK